MSCQIKENELFMSCQLWETTIVKLIKTTEKQNNNHACFIITHCSKSCNICKCSVTFVYHTIKLELFITNTIKLSQTKRSRQRKKVAPAKKKVVPKVRKCSPEWKKGYISSMKLYARVYDTNRAPYICYLDRENERELCSFCKFSDIIIRRPNRSDKIVIFEGEMNVHM